MGLASRWTESRPDTGLGFRVVATRNSGFVRDGAASSDPAAIRGILTKNLLLNLIKKHEKDNPFIAANGGDATLCAPVECPMVQ
jgi:hypothetical protein